MCSNKSGEEKASHIVSAWSKEDGFCLGQKAVEEKSNEITAIPELLEKIISFGKSPNSVMCCSWERLPYWVPPSPT